MAGKKPVWVDEDAHAILKAYSKLNKRSMLDIASDLVLNRLNTLLEEPKAEEAPVEEVAAAPAPEVKEEVKVKPEPRKKIKPVRPSRDDGDVRYLGGVWLV